MFSAAIKTSTSRGCGSPTVVRTHTGSGTPASFNIGSASDERIIVVSVSTQSQYSDYVLTLNGASPLVIYNGFSTTGGQVAFAIWKAPTGTTATFTSSATCEPISVYAIYGWSGYKVVQFNSFYGFDGTNWAFTASPMPANTILFGTWSTNEDGDASLKQYNFGTVDRFFYNASQHDGGTAYELITVADPARSITCNIGGKRRSYGFLSLSCENAAI
jgi:hypothetical protein